MVEPQIYFEAKKHRASAKEYIDNAKKTDGLLKRAILKARNNKGTLGDAWEKLQLFFDLIQAYTKGEYRNVAPSTILTIIGAILYFVSPLDAVPDFLAGLGILDDAAVISFTLKKLSVEINEFKKWKDNGSKSITIPHE